MKNNIPRHMSESFLTVAFLSLSGGLQDVYTYLLRDEVFANAQTGNIVLLAVNLVDRNWISVMDYLIPLLAFAFGIALTEGLRTHSHWLKKLHWRQLIVLFEILLLLLVGWIPYQWNILANAIVSFSCAMQVQAFRKVNGYPFASTMCIGNIRSCMEALCAGRSAKALCYFAIILLFAAGAAMGHFFMQFLGLHTIWLSCLLLFISFLFMFSKEKLAIC